MTVGILVALGRVGRPHGIRGEMRVLPYNAQSSLLIEQKTLHIGGKTYDVESAHVSGDMVLLALRGIGTREAAETLKGAEVAVPRAELPALGDAELYLTDLVGCVCWEGEVELGRVVSVVTYPASTCFVIESEGGRREVPAVPPYFAAIDVAEKRIELAHTSDFPLEHVRPKKVVRTP